MGVPEGEAKGKGAEKNIQENNIWNFLKLMKSIGFRCLMYTSKSSVNSKYDKHKYPHLDIA